MLSTRSTPSFLNYVKIFYLLQKRIVKFLKDSQYFLCYLQDCCSIFFFIFVRITVHVSAIMYKKLKHYKIFVCYLQMNTPALTTLSAGRRWLKPMKKRLVLCYFLFAISLGDYVSRSERRTKSQYED